MCEDEAPARAALVEHLLTEGYAAVGAADGHEALVAYASHMPDAVILDLRMPRVDGLEVLRQLRSSEPELPIIVVTANASIDSAILATKLGATAYLVKPVDAGEVLLQLSRALDRPEEAGGGGSAGAEGYGGFIGSSAATRRLVKMLTAIERVRSPTVLMTGETGTGKDLLARAIHARGSRREGPFQAVDCTAISPHLIESELFGHERGSFTDAHATKRGLFELAQDGVVFLDEIGEMLPAMQAKLLRTLEARTFRRVGGVVELPFEAAIIAATNRDLASEAKRGAFREDLFFRLNIIPITVPPLRERLDDIEPIAAQLVRRLCEELGRAIPGITPATAEVLRSRTWPGNVRELRNVLHRAIIMKVNDAALEPHDLSDDDGRASTGRHASLTGVVLPDEGVDLAEVERGLLLQALARTHGNITQAAKLLHITRFAFRYRLQKHGLPDPPS